MVPCSQWKEHMGPTIGSNQGVAYHHLDSPAGDLILLIYAALTPAEYEVLIS